MKKKIINGLLFAVALVAATSSFVSCKDYEGDNYAELNEKCTALQAAYLAQVSAMKDYVLTSRYNSETGYSAAELAAKGTIAARLDDLEEYQESLENDSFPKYAELIHKNNLAIAKAQGLAERDSAYLRSLLAGWDNGGTLGDMVTEAAGLLTALKSDTAKYKFAYDTLSTYYKQWNEAVKVADSAWNFVNKGKVNVLGKDIENLQEMATLYDSAIADLHERIDSLCDEMDAIKNTLRKEVTGIEIQATINPIYGTFAYPFDVQSNVLAMYYGEIKSAGKTWYFPAAEKDKNWVYTYDDGIAPVLESELKAIKAPGFGGEKAEVFHDGDIVMEDKEGNAGKLYLTVNPSNVNFDKAMFTLRNSKNEVSKVELSPLAESNDELLWGYRRSAANGFYETQATISKNVVKDVALNFDFTQVKSEAKNILDNFGKVSTREAVVDVAKLGLAVMNAMQTKAPRLGVQYQWKDELTGWKNYVSKYELAAVSAKPLGFDALNVLDHQFDAKIVKIKNALTAKESAYKKEIENYLTIQLGIQGTGDIKYDEATGRINLVIKKEKFGSVDLNAFKTALNNVIQFCNDNGATPQISKITADYSLLNEDIKVDITEMFTAFNQIQTKLGDANTKIQNVLDRLIIIQNRLFDKAAQLASTPSRYIQPALLASNQSLGYFYPSRTYFAPTQVKAGETIKLYPTTLTGEVVAPAYMKYVAILAGPKATTNYNDGVEGLNAKLQGNKYNLHEPIEITLTEKGVYEFIYQAVGYNGIVSGKKYYIEVY